MPDLVPQLVAGFPVVEASRLPPECAWSWAVVCDLGPVNPTWRAVCWLLDVDHRPHFGHYGDWPEVKATFDKRRARFAWPEKEQACAGS